ncbi:ABC transporter permease [Yinghuangia aomiensis]
MVTPAPDRPPPPSTISPGPRTAGASAGGGAALAAAPSQGPARTARPVVLRLGRRRPAAHGRLRSADHRRHRDQSPGPAPVRIRRTRAPSRHRRPGPRRPGPGGRRGAAQPGRGPGPGADRRGRRQRLGHHRRIGRTGRAHRRDAHTRRAVRVPGRAAGRGHRRLTRERGVERGALAVGGAGAPVARVAETETARLRGMDFMDSARASGAKRGTIAVRQVLPNLLPTIVVYCTALAGLSIVFAAGLSFLGLGTAPPHAEWGLMVNDLRPYIFTDPALSLVPAGAILIASVVCNMLGDGLRDLLDVRREVTA